MPRKKEALATPKKQALRKHRDKPKTVRMSSYVPEDVHKVLKRLAQQWRVPLADVTRILIERGLTIEAFFEMHGQIYAQTPDGKVFPFEDDRPRTRRSLIAENEFTKLLKSADGADGGEVET